MGLQPSSGGKYVSGTNFAPTTSTPTTLAFAVLMDFTIGQADIQAIISDQDGGAANQHFLGRINGAASGAQADKWDITIYGSTGTIHHYLPSAALSASGKQLVAGVITAAEFGSIRSYYNKASETVNSDHGSDAGGWNASANPITLFTRGAGDKPFNQKCYWIAIWNADPGDAAFDAMSGKTTPGVFKSPLQYSPANLVYFFDCQSNGTTFTEQITGEIYTKTGTISLIATASGIEDSYCKRATADTTLLQASPTNDQGGGATFIVGHNASANTGRRRPLLRFPNLITAGAAANTTVGYAALRLYSTAAAGDVATTGKICRVTRNTWVEGASDSTGATYNTYDFTNAWSPGAVDGAAAGTGGDYTTTGSDAFSKSNQTGFAAGIIVYTNPLVTAAILANSGTAEFLMRYDTEQAGAAALQTQTYSSKEGANAVPLYLVTYTNPGGGGTGGGKLNLLLD